MFYRAAAVDYLEEAGVPVVRRARDTVLTFIVEGQARAYDFTGERGLDLIVLYEPGKPPKAVAPAVVHEADEYFGLDDDVRP